MTGYGFAGPMTAMGTTFDAKAEGAAGNVPMMTLMGVGSYILWFMLGAGK